MVESSRIKFNPEIKEIEIEGPEKFVKTILTEFRCCCSRHYG